MRIVKIGLGRQPQPFEHEYQSEEQARIAIEFTRSRGEFWMLETDLDNQEPVRGEPCGLGWPE